MIAARETEDRLSDDELFGTVVLVLAAGHETTTNLIGNGLYTLLRHPSELARLGTRRAVVQHDIGAAAVEHAAHGGPDAARASGDEHYLLFHPLVSSRHSATGYNSN